MLKWVVNGAKPTYMGSLPKTVDSGTCIEKANTNTPKANVAMKRKSSSFTTISRRSCFQNDENHMTSTPVNPQQKHTTQLELSKLENVNIFDLTITGPPQQTTKLQSIENVGSYKSPKSNRANSSRNYASTLPTFEAEYSPCSVIPGPILALRGIAIPDTYFEKPFYFTQEHKDIVDQNKSSTREPNTKKPIENLPKQVDISTLSSTKMGDITLERMIDAILESTRKERKFLRSSKTFNCASAMSPTYRPAEDPASDLNEFWQEECARKPLSTGKRKAKYREREICSPIARRLRTEKVFQLKRQRALRRKRQIDRQKKGAKDRAQSDEELYVNLPVSAPKSNPANASPDSGHNSFSDSENSILIGQSGLGNMEGEESENCLDVTKRRLSFSNNKII